MYDNAGSIKPAFFSSQPTSVLHRLHNNPLAHLEHPCPFGQQVWSWSRNSPRPSAGVLQIAQRPSCSSNFCSNQLYGIPCDRSNARLHSQRLQERLRSLNSCSLMKSLHRAPTQTLFSFNPTLFKGDSVFLQFTCTQFEFVVY